MKEIGRKIVLNHGKHIVSIEVIPSKYNPYSIPKNGLVLSVQEVLGEIVYKELGESFANTHGATLNDIVENFGIDTWKIKEN